MMIGKDVSTVTLPPDPSSLTESLRGMGYTLATAVSDIVDNSISAEARTIEICMNRAEGDAEAGLSILDDGFGMSRDELVNAMVLGAVSPLKKRDKRDLGRFGLGLKTASFSQCRRLTVVSKKNGRLSSFSWDLDFLAKTQEWSLIENDPRVHAAEIPGESGTLVLWEKIDRVPAMQEDAPRLEWAAAREKLRNHLSLTFHRFIDDEDVVLKLDGRPIKGWDPFFAMHPGKPKDFPESVWPVGSVEPKARLQPFVLPVNPGSGRKRTLFGPDDDLNLQGFFIYRGKRLITYGGWLGLKDLRKGDAFKLARIRLEFENEGDADWRVDIRKCTAHPPVEMKPWLRQFAINARTVSEQMLISTGGPAKTVRASGLWKKAGKGSPVLPDGGSPVMETLFAALKLGRLSPEVLNGYVEILGLAHPATLKAGLSWVPTRDARTAVAVVWEMLANEYGPEQAASILRTTEPFSNWGNLIDEVAGDD